MNYFDRYLSVKVVDKSKVELLNWLCLHIASSRFDKYSEHLSFVMVFLKIVMYRGRLRKFLRILIPFRKQEYLKWRYYLC